MTVLNYTTTISAEKTIGEMQRLLAQHGAARVALDYENGHAVGLTFELATPHGQRTFSLPVDVDAMSRLLVERSNAGKLRSGSKAQHHSREQAERTAWRVMKDWLSAQLTLVSTRMASLDQVMLPYLHVDGERTLYAAYRQQEQLLELEQRSS